MPIRLLDRVEGGARLADALAAYRDHAPIVLGIARGGVVTASEVARRLHAPLGVVVARKLAAPDQPELAIGAVTADGERYLNDELIAELAIDDAYVAAETARQVAVARDRETQLRAGRSPLAVEGRVVIVVDDGLATAATMRAALRSVRARHPAWLVAAVPVGARDSCAAIADEADAVVCPWQPDPFIAVGLHYERFTPTTDAEARELLAAPHFTQPSRR